jgi:hypothetical protein
METSIVQDLLQAAQGSMPKKDVARLSALPKRMRLPSKTSSPSFEERRFALLVLLDVSLFAVIIAPAC